MYVYMHLHFHGCVGVCLILHINVCRFQERRGTHQVVPKVWVNVCGLLLNSLRCQL